MASVFIYALKEPDTGEIRYIGKTCDITTRLVRHLSEARRSRDKSHRIFWFKSLLSRGLQPHLEILDEVPFEHWQQWEVAYIEFFQECSCNLVNGTPGGGGNVMRGETHPMFGKHHSEAVRQKMGDAQRGKKGNNFGKHHSESSKQKLRQARLGKRHSEATRLKISISLSGERNPMFGKTGEKCPMFGRTGEKHPSFGRPAWNKGKPANPAQRGNQ